MWPEREGEGPQARAARKRWGRGAGDLFFSSSTHSFIDSFRSLRNVSWAGPGDQKYKSRDFSSDSVVNALSFCYKGHSFNPWSEN